MGNKVRHHFIEIVNTFGHIKTDINKLIESLQMVIVSGADALMRVKAEHALMSLFPTLSILMVLTRGVLLREGRKSSFTEGIFSTSIPVIMIPRNE
jgi:hypothetical protein